MVPDNARYQRNTVEITQNRSRLARGESLQPVIATRPKPNIQAVSGHSAAIEYTGIEVARVVSRPEEPLRSGAVVWIETPFEVEIINEAPKPVELVDESTRLRAVLVNWFREIISGTTPAPASVPVTPPGPVALGQESVWGQLSRRLDFDHIHGLIPGSRVCPIGDGSGPWRSSQTR